MSQLKQAALIQNSDLDTITIPNFSRTLNLEDNLKIIQSNELFTKYKYRIFNDLPEMVSDALGLPKASNNVLTSGPLDHSEYVVIEVENKADIVTVIRKLYNIDINLDVLHQIHTRLLDVCAQGSIGLDPQRNHSAVDLLIELGCLESKDEFNTYVTELINETNYPLSTCDYIALIAFASGHKGFSHKVNLPVKLMSGPVSATSIPSFALFDAKDDVVATIDLYEDLMAVILHKRPKDYIACLELDVKSDLIHKIVRSNSRTDLLLNNTSLYKVLDFIKPKYCMLVSGTNSLIQGLATDKNTKINHIHEESFDLILDSVLKNSFVFPISKDLLTLIDPSTCSSNTLATINTAFNNFRSYAADSYTVYRNYRSRMSGLRKDERIKRIKESLIRTYLYISTKSKVSVNPNELSRLKSDRISLLPVADNNISNELQNIAQLMVDKNILKDILTSTGTVYNFDPDVPIYRDTFIPFPSLTKKYYDSLTKETYLGNLFNRWNVPYTNELNCLNTPFLFVKEMASFCALMDTILIATTNSTDDIKDAYIGPNWSYRASVITVFSKAYTSNAAPHTTLNVLLKELGFNGTQEVLQMLLDKSYYLMSSVKPIVSNDTSNRLVTQVSFNSPVYLFNGS